MAKRPDMNDLHLAGVDITRLPHRPAVLDLMPISPEAIELAARSSVAALWAPEAMETASLMRQRLPDAYAALRAGLRQLRGYAKEVDRWDREVERRAKGRPGVGAGLDVGPSGTPLITLANAVRALRYEIERADGEPRHLTTCTLDTFANVATVDGEKITDARESKCAIWLDEVHNLKGLTSALAGEALRVIAADHAYHPVREYLDGLTWDGVIRTPTWLSTYLGVDDTPLHREYSRMWLISAVARVMRPGCKVDTVLTLVGHQGTRKSTALRTLAGDGWFADTPIDIRDKDARQGLNGVWIYEWAELEQMSRSENSAIKAFITAQVDHYRPSYGRNTVDVPRQTLIVASTNDPKFLKDPTGSRRFWPVWVGSIDVEGLREVRDQLWAEARMLWSIGTPWWLTASMDAERAAAADDFATADPWESAILERLRSSAATAADLLTAVGIPVAGRRPSDVQRAGECARKLGAEPSRPAMGHGRKGPTVWRLP